MKLIKKVYLHQKLFSKSNNNYRQDKFQHLQNKNLPKWNDNQCKLCKKNKAEEEVKKMRKE